MPSNPDAMARARALVREVLAAAGERDPRASGAAPLDPPPPPTEARRVARRLVEEVLAADADGGDGAQDVAGDADVASPVRPDGPGGPPPTPPRSRPRALTDAQARARRIVAAALADEADRLAAEEARRREAAEAAEAASAAVPGSPDAATRPSARIDLLPNDLPTPPGPQSDPTEPMRPEAPTETMPTAPSPETDEPLDLAPDVIDAAPESLQERWRQRRRLKRLQAQWAEDATPAPRRTGRWLVVTILLVAAIVLLFPLAVEALRDLVAL